MPGIQPPDTTHAELTRRLGEHAVPLADGDAHALTLLDLMTGPERLSANQALKRIGLSWGWLHRYRTNHPDFWAEYQSVRDTLADALASAGAAMLNEGLEDVKASDPKLGNALASLWREKSRYAMMLAERASARWRADAPTTPAGAVQVVVVLPALAPLPPLASGTTLAASASAASALTAGPDCEYEVSDASDSEEPQLPASVSELTGESLTARTRTR